MNENKQEAKLKKVKKKAYMRTQGENIQGMNGWMNPKKQIKKKEKIKAYTQGETSKGRIEG